MTPPTTSMLRAGNQTEYRDDSHRQVLMTTGADLRGPFQPLHDQLFGQILRTI